MLITKQWLKKNSQKGAMTREQLATLGIGWTPPKGWKAGLIGRSISDETAKRIELLAAIRDGEVKKEEQRKAEYDAAEQIYYTWPDHKGSWKGSSEKPKWWDKRMSRLGD